MEFDKIIKAKIMELYEFFRENEMHFIIGAIDPEDEAKIHLSLMCYSFEAKDIYDAVRDVIEEDGNKDKAENESNL